MRSRPPSISSASKGPPPTWLSIPRSPRSSSRMGPPTPRPSCGPWDWARTTSSGTVEAGRTPKASKPRRRITLSRSRRYYPGFFGALFLLLLRVAIGWHFLYEGLEKIESTRKGGKPFSAEVYLRNATGPLAPRFRALVPDVNSLEKLNESKLKARWAADVDRIANHYHFDEKQRADARHELDDAEKNAEIWFLDKETNEKRRKYYTELREVQRVERSRDALSYER